MNILMLLIKNTAALDFALPLLCKIRHDYPQTNVSVLYCALNRQQFLRKSRYYTDVLYAHGVQQYDFADFLQEPYKLFPQLWKRLFSGSHRDSSPWEQRLHWLPFGKRVARRLRSFLDRLETLLTSKVNFQQMMLSLAPDIVLFDNTVVTQFTGREQVYAYLASLKKKVILLPHAPHHGYTTAQAPFDEDGEILPDYCEFWMPFKFDKSWKKVPDQKAQFAYVGYPGLDSEWLEQFSRDTGHYSSDTASLIRLQEPLKCMFIIRRFMAKGQSSPEAYIYNYEEFSHYLSLVGTAINEAGIDIELIVKPHPSNDFGALQEVFAESGIPNWRVTHDPIYASLSEIDFVISLYSTVFFIPAMSGIPIVMLKSSIQPIVHQEDIMKQLYTGFRFYLENPDDLPLRLREIIAIALERRRTGEAWPGDVEHLRYFYPDGATRRCLDRLELDTFGSGKP